MKVLRMFNPPAQILLLRVGVERLLENVQHLTIGAIADRMYAKL